MRVHPTEIEVFVSSNTLHNPYNVGDRESLNIGLYCETVMEQRAHLLVPDALADPDWDDNPDIKLNMIAYLGFPLIWPNDDIFGTICVLDQKANLFSQQHIDLMQQFSEIINDDLKLLNEQVNHQKTSQSLRQSEECYRLLAENSNDIIVLLDLTGHVLYLSPAYSKVMGYEPSDRIGKHPATLIHPDDKDGFLQAFARLHETLHPFQHTARFQRKDGIYVWLEIAARYIFDEHGQPLQIIANLRDVSQRKTMEDALRNSETMYRSIFEHNQAVKLLIDPATGQIIDANSAAVDYYGYPRDVLLRMAIHEINMLTEAEVNEEMRRAYREERSHFNFKHQLSNGEIRDVEVFSGRVEIKDNPLLYSIIVDVTARTRAEERLRRSEQRMKMTLQGTRAGTWEWHIQTGETVFNERWAEIGGYTLDELAPTSIQTWIDLIHPDDLALSDTLLKQHFAGEIPYYECEARMKHKDGHWVWVLDRGTVLEWDADGQPLRMFGTHVDITARKHNQQRNIELTLEHERRNMLVTFVRDAAHEFRTPLSTISSSTYLMAKYNDIEQRARKAEQINVQIERIAKLVDMLLMMVKLDSGSTPTHHAVNLSALLQDVIHHAEGKCLAQHNLKVDIPDELPMVLVHADYLAEAFQQIIDNAHRFTPESGTIWVRAGFDDQNAWVEVEDNGQGMTDDVLPHIFETFWRQDTMHSTAGFGLGLPIAQKIITHYQGTITVKSVVDKGSVFRIVLPTHASSVS